MEALLNYNNNNYSINVTGENRGYPDDQALLIPQVSIVWKVIKSYHLDTDTAKRPPITVHNTRHELNFPYQSFTSDDISNMISGIAIPFQMHRLRWKERFETKKDPLEISFDDMISKIVCVANDMVCKASVSGQKKVDMLVTIEKQIRLPHSQYEAVVRATKDEETLQSLSAMHSVMLQQEARQGRTSTYNSPNRVLRRYLDEIASSTAAAGMNISLEDTMGYAMGQAMRESSNQARLRPVPATKASVEALKKLAFDGVHGKCTVCMEEILLGSQVTCLPCSHVFHEGCIGEWLLKWSHMCPVCRFKLPTEN